ncbi:MAG: hypothetical protein K0Q58_814 [Microbacterium sp.]|nr:hypothetical protein [Microbacterium sp.]
MPPIATARWYEAPLPGAFTRFASWQESTEERVRSQVMGAALVTVCPAAMVATVSLGSDWQSVERHQVSFPLVIVNPATCW